MNSFNVLVYSLNKAFVEMEDILPTLGFKREEVYYYVSNVISRIINCYDRISLNKQDEEYRFVLALRYVNNCLKHNPSLKLFHCEIGGASTWPMRADGKGLYTLHVWASLDDVTVQQKFYNSFESQRKEYKKYLKGKSILYTLRYYVNQINLVHMPCNEIPFADDYCLQYAFEHDWKIILLEKEE